MLSFMKEGRIRYRSCSSIQAGIDNMCHQSFRKAGYGIKVGVVYQQESTLCNTIHEERQDILVNALQSCIFDNAHALRFPAHEISMPTLPTWLADH